MYSDIVKAHFSNPRNVGKLENPDLIGTAKNEADGDQVQLHIKLNGNQIADIKMKVMGCVAAIASTSLFTEMIKGKTITEAAAISKEELTAKLGGLPEHKIQCSLTCIDAFKNAIEKKD